MSESVITSSIITIACVVCATMLITTLYPAMDRASSSVTATAEAMGDQIKTDIEIIEVTHDDSWGGSSWPGLVIWVKNTGSSQLADSQIEKFDLFFSEVGNTYSRKSHSTDWTYVNENNPSGERWKTSETLKITLSSTAIKADTDYYVKILTHNGVSTEDTFSFVHLS